MSRRTSKLASSTSASTRAQLMAALESEDKLLTEAGAEMDRIKADLDDHIEEARKLRAAFEILGVETPEPPASE